MLFTAANFIILGVVLVVLVVYRQLDRDNRSLEKVKKYSDKLKDDISAYVDKRSDDLQRYAIELDVQQKAAREILKRIQGVEEGLSARAEAIGSIEKRLSEYDTVLSRLMQMSAAVDENLARLHEENDFTESVGRKLDAAQKGLLALERELPGLKDGFAQDNGLALEGFKNKLLVEVNTRLEETTSLLARSEAEAKALVLKVADSRREAEKELALAFQKAREEAEKLEDAAFEKLRENSDAKAARLKETVEEKFREIGQTAKDKAAETQAFVKALKQDWKNESEGLLHATQAEVGAAAEDLGKRLDLADQRIQEMEKSLGERAERIERKAEEVASALQEKAKAALAAYRDELDRRIAESKAATQASAAELVAVVAKAEGLNADIVKRGAELEARLAQVGADLETKVAAGFARRLDEYSSEIETKFAHLESVNADIGVLEAALREAMAVSEARVESDFASFQTAFKAKSARFDEGFAAEAARLRESMKSLETELDALKARAYENVSEKLKVFEDEFFADIKSRSEAIDARLLGWKEDLDRKLETLAGASAAERQAAEREAMDALKAHLADSQAKAQEQLEKLRERVQGIADGIAAQGGMAKDALEALKAAVLQDTADARRTAQAYVEAELARLNLESDQRIKGVERTVETELARVAAAVSGEAEKVRGLREGTEAAAAAFKADFGTALAETRKVLEGDLDGFKATTLALSASLRSEYEGQRDGFARQSQAERDRLSKELANLADRSAELRQDLSSRINQALEGFARSYENFVADLARRQKEAESESEARLRSFNDAAADLVLKVETSRAQAFGKTETEAARLGQTLADIDKELKAYIAQSKVFERTEALKTDLSAAIDSMKQDLSRLDGRKAEITEIENQLGRIKRLEEEMGQKVARFLAEKKRIDALEADFGRLSEVSQGVDRKLEEVTGQSDALMETQAKIRKLLDLASEAEGKFDRLEKKAAVMDATTESVDKNFQQTQAIEKLVNALGAELKRMPERIAEVKRSVDTVLAGKEAVDETARKLGDLDGILGDAEKRIAEAQKVREWLARAETRMEEINRQAQDQLKVLSTLLKDEGSPGRTASRGAPPSTVQDTVRKLARQGWAADEIARAVKISRGEVELILELGGKS